MMTARQLKAQERKARNARLEQLAREESERMGRVNTAIQNGVKVIHRSPGSHCNGLAVKYLYEGCPGTWMVDEKGGHWCLGSTPTDYIDQIENVKQPCCHDFTRCDKHSNMVLAIHMAWRSWTPEKFAPIWALQDGYGTPGYMPPQGLDWSGIRDSSIEAIERMYAALRIQ